ncbi:GrpB family protein [Alkalibacillus salilacus]|uniref:GrpB-like predicted nucleotidyltransferase (UPF0157 family) n=1 Tax=Alkalibacillus salilacus TaxID=284582 RepID=A0ABT9VFL7_9BACI|nr:GrpB family protein [Alkalibacillus salilacus]MDQ0159600.1 GrpB-like predicted nucleotidyltransferase (UPF0157 family) [Alkalibacillus salilacus]
MREVIVCSYNPDWILRFKHEAEKLQEVFISEDIIIYHIGSTAIPGLKAKPIIDIMVVIDNIVRVDQYVDGMRNLGYEPKGENGIPGRCYFQKGGDRRSHHVHVFEVGSPDIDRHLAFRDYLNTYPNDKHRYGDLKYDLAKAYPHDVASYIKGKESLVEEIEAKAIHWYHAQL